MSYLRMDYTSLLEGIRRIKTTNTSMMNGIAHHIESLLEVAAGTEVESLVREFDHKNNFFREAESVFEEIWDDLEDKNLTKILVNRLSNLGTTADDFNSKFRDGIDKERFYIVTGTAEDLNTCYSEIGDNFLNISELDAIADALNRNFLYAAPPKGCERSRHSIS